ncbi:hypothetical protein Arad_2210 [Rhizobium rhizogenes K84]|uniref:Uncharacterized protein n=1 Tax=Rhizobium rhizogenes (strain K84 / ATCC BAA-868) TaxID=311403 RepID=B9JEN3_RHIR8|nr:hypothetical protein Arad_2210 [Rhizobium rhizogenes K84]
MAISGKTGCATRGRSFTFSIIGFGWTAATTFLIIARFGNE